MKDVRTEVLICVARREHCALHSSLLLSRNLSRNRTHHSFASSVARMLLLSCSRALRSSCQTPCASIGIGVRVKTSCQTRHSFTDRVLRLAHCALHSSLLLNYNLSRNRTCHSFASSVVFFNRTCCFRAASIYLLVDGHYMWTLFSFL